MSPLFPRFYRCPGSPYDTETADGCTGAYLLHWDTDTTGQKVGLVFTWLFIGVLALVAIYSLWIYCRARYRYQRTAPARRPARYATRELWSTPSWRRQRQQEKEMAMAVNDGQAQAPAYLAYARDEPFDAPMAPPLPPPKDPVVPVSAHIR